MTTRSFLKHAASFVALFLLGSLVQAAPNLFPEPGFETSGTTETAHSGKRAGTMTITGGKGWKAMEFPPAITVEPFATYRTEGWVKGTADGGSVVALYSYGWNSYGWWFMRQAPIKSATKWQKVSTTFIMPVNRVTFHPLVSNGCRNAKAYIDDVSITRIASPAETIARLRAKSSPNTEERLLLARWFLGQNNLTAAEKLMDGADNTVRADVSCLLAQGATDDAEKLRRMADMIRYDCMRWPDAPKRLRELSADLALPDRLGLCLEALKLAQGSSGAAKAIDVLLPFASFGDGTRAVAELDTELSGMEHAVATFAAAGNTASVAPLNEKLTAARTQLEERKATMGTARLIISRRHVTSETHQIVIPDAATPQEEHAASELRSHLEMITGVSLTVARDSEADSRIPIIVGKSALLKKRGIRIDYARLGDEGIRMLVGERALILTGNKRGVLYAVYTFLEDYCGCRWFTADCTRIPRTGTIRISGGLDVTYIPPFEYRDTDYPNRRPPQFGVRNKLNGAYSRAPGKWGGNLKYRGFVHTFRNLVPPETYFAKHPEYYSEIKGVRVGPDHSQLCLTNPDVTRIAIETVRRWMRESPDCQIISVSQNDWRNYCECSACNALAEKEASQAGPLLHFVNAIADAVRDERPDLIIDTLAYQYTRKPPKIVKPRPNVAVRLCSIECCFVHTLEDCPFNKTFVDDIKGWDAISDRLHIWDYVINYAHTIQPFPNLRVLKPNIEFFRDHGVTGIYEEANYFSRGGELAELRTYVMAKLLWAPEYNAKTAIREFVTNYYGPAADPISRYLKLIHRNVCSNRKRHVRIYTPPSAYLNDEKMLAKARELFDEAEEVVAGDATLLHRVRVARMPIQYTQLALGKSAFRLVDDGFVSGSTAAEGLLDTFVATARAEKVSHIREGKRGDFETWVEGMESVNRPVKLLRLRTPHLETALIPGLGGRVWSVKHVATGQEMVRQFGDDKNGWHPSKGGIEEYSTSDYHAPGWTEAYKIVEQGDTFAVLEATLSNGFSLRRRVELAADRPALIITSNLVNSGSAARSAQFRIHPAFAVVDTAKASLWMKGRTKWSEKSLANPADPKAENELWLRDAACPSGAWAIRDNSCDLTILNTFDPQQVAFYYANWNGAQKRVNLEQWSQRAKLAPGKSLTIRNVYEITDRLPE
ncbi:MAG: DUF4838 domain-containing protein [Lentisphaerae bacterium]|nr:DUF4838 domain-containing protein [Lentisphaerota bacterium]